MSLLTWQTGANPFQGMMKDDSAVFPDAFYKHREVNRPDTINRHIWSKSGFINCFDSTSDGSCPNNLFTTWEDSWEWPQFDDIKNGGRNMPVFKIQGVTKDSGGNPLGGVRVELFRELDDTKQGEAVSDAAGNYLLYTPFSDTHYIVAFKAPNLAGSTVHTLTGV